jgi:hypothetical protein
VKEKGCVQIKSRKSEQKEERNRNQKISREKETRLIVGTLALGNDPIVVRVPGRILQENQRK